MAECISAYDRIELDEWVEDTKTKLELFREDWRLRHGKADLTQDYFEFMKKFIKYCSEFTDRDMEVIW